MNFLTAKKYTQKLLRLHSYYKPGAIRYAKHISLLLALVCIIVTAVILVHPEEKTNIKTPANSGGAPDRKIQIEQAKKNSILRRFISYTEVKNVL